MGSSISTVSNSMAYGRYSSNATNNMNTQSLVVIQPIDPIRPPVTLPEKPVYPTPP
jgi:hypothetical protein